MPPSLLWQSGSPARLDLPGAASVTATLEPSDISVGEAAQLTVTVQGRSADEPQIPPVNGLDFQPVGQSSQIQIINGAMSANVSYTYAVAATQSGSFTIPAIKSWARRGHCLCRNLSC